MQPHHRLIVYHRRIGLHHQWYFPVTLPQITNSRSVTRMSSASTNVYHIWIQQFLCKMYTDDQSKAIYSSLQSKVWTDKERQLKIHSPQGLHQQCNAYQKTWVCLLCNSQWASTKPPWPHQIVLCENVLSPGDLLCYSTSPSHSRDYHHHGWKPQCTGSFRHYYSDMCREHNYKSITHIAWASSTTW